METKILSANDRLISQLDYKLPPSSSYIVERDSVQFHPSGSAFYGPNGSRVIKFNMTDANKWLDQSSVHFVARVQNLSGSAKTFLPLWSCFSRMIVRCAGRVVEDVRDVGTWWQLQNRLMGDRSNNEYIKAGCKAISDSLNGNNTSSVAANATYEASFRISCGLFNQTKYIPLRYMPIEIELELDSGINFTADGTTADFELSNITLDCDLITVDNALNDSYSKFLLEGGVIDLHMSNVFSNTHNVSISGTLDASINISRAVSRLNSYFAVLSSSSDDKNIAFLGLNDTGAGIEVGLRVGSKNYPQRPLTSHSQILTSLQRVVGHNRDLNGSLQISPNHWGQGQIILGFDLEKELGASYTGLSTKSGELLTLNIKSGDTVGRVVRSFLMYDAIVSISSNGVELFD